jgi:hypothetical protein
MRAFSDMDVRINHEKDHSMASTLDRRPSLSAPRPYQKPVLTFIGDACEVVLGVAGGGDDFMGYSDPEFEYDADLDDGGATIALSTHLPTSIRK